MAGKSESFVVGDSTGRLVRQPTGVRGLDAVLEGGLFKGSLTLLLGDSGSGKTVLSSEICYRTVAEGAKAAVITMHAESHGKLLSQLAAFSFFEESYVPNEIRYVSATSAMADPSLKALTELIGDLFHSLYPSIVVFDDLDAIFEFAQNDAAYSRFLSTLSTMSSLYESSFIAISNTLHRESRLRGAAIADSIIVMHTEESGLRSAREVEIRKLRGSHYLEGRHFYQIDRHGIDVAPRFEAWFPVYGKEPKESAGRVGFGIAHLDEMLNGGVPESSSTLLAGTTGTGKTVLGLHFLAEGARQGEVGIYFGFHESAPRIAGKARQLGLPIDDYLEKSLFIHWETAGQGDLDNFAYRLLNEIERTGAKRVFLDGLNALYTMSHYPVRLPTYLTALANELRSRGISAIFSEELKSAGQTPSGPPGYGASGQVENILMLQQIEHEAEKRRLISIVKMREGNYDSALREFKITPEGVWLSPSAESAKEILCGKPRGG